MSKAKITSFVLIDRSCSGFGELLVLELSHSGMCCGDWRFRRPVPCLGRPALLPVLVSRAVVWELWEWLGLAGSSGMFYPRTSCPWVHAWLLGWQEGR